MTIFNELMGLLLFLGLSFNAFAVWYSYKQFKKKKNLVPATRYISPSLVTWTRFLKLITGRKSDAYNYVLRVGNGYLLIYLILLPKQFSEIETSTMNIIWFGLSVATLMLTTIFSIDLMIESKRRFPLAMFFTEYELRDAFPTDYFDTIDFETFFYKVDVTDMTCLDTVVKYKAHPEKNKETYVMKLMSLYVLVPEEYYEKDVMEKKKKMNFIFQNNPKSTSKKQVGMKNNVIFAEDRFLKRRGS